MTSAPRDFLAACRKAGRDPESIRDPEAYLRAYYRAGEKIRSIRETTKRTKR